MTAATMPAPRVASTEPPAIAAPRRAGLLAAPWAPFFAGVLTAAMQWLVWRSFKGVPAISDEAAYALQAKLFAHFRWTAPAPPIREFFEQMHVLMSPVVASKYPPGHSLLLAFGAALGMPGLVPVLLGGATGGLLFALARRVGNEYVALLAWLMWTCLPVQEGLRPSYFSEVTTTVTFLLGWWALLRWRDDNRTGWLVLLSVATAWCAVTRPITAVAYAIPTGAVTLAMIRRRRAWRPAMIAIVAGFVVVAILPLWNWRTTGSVLTSPYLAYDHVYLAFEHLGFGDNGGRAPTWLPRDLYYQVAGFANVHAQYTPGTMPHELLLRLRYTWIAYFGNATWSVMLSAFIVVGIFVAGVENLVILATVVTLYAVHLVYAYPASWTIYYYEIIAPLCFLAALGVWRAIQMIAALRGRTASPSFARRTMIGVALTCLPFALATQGSKRSGKAAMTWGQTSFARGAERLPTPAIVFIRYAPNHLNQASLVDNDPDFAHAAVWKVYDRGDAENARLRALAPERKAFIYDEASRTFYALK
jgi:hypothetical protein